MCLSLQEWGTGVLFICLSPTGFFACQPVWCAIHNILEAHPSVPSVSPCIPVSMAPKDSGASFHVVYFCENIKEAL